MKEHFDILLDDDFDLLASGGDLVTGDSLIQQQAILLTVVEGEIKQSPNTGVGISTYLNDEDTQSLYSKIKSQFRKDNLTVLHLSMSEKLEILAKHA